MRLFIRDTQWVLDCEKYGAELGKILGASVESVKKL